MATRQIKNLDELMDGAVNEQFNQNLAQLWDNVFDPNTDPKKVRVLTMKIKIAPNERRDSAEMRVSFSKTLAQNNDLAQTVMLEVSGNGSIIATERTDQIPGQVYMDGSEEPAPKMVSFKASAN